MGYLRRPAYYKRFKCISSACTDSCCQEWEIDIDDDTLEYYMQVEGEFGKRLKDNIMLSENGATIETAHFIQTDNERCPFLNDCNLCDIFIELGEEHLSHICTHHPRYYDWFVEGQEAGLGLCCEEAARLILEKSGYPEFECICDSDAAEQVTDEDLLFEKKLEQMLFDMRETLFGIVKSDKNDSIDVKMDKLYEKAQEFQDRYDECMFHEAEAEEGICIREDVNGYEEGGCAKENMCIYKEGDCTREDVNGYKEGDSDNHSDRESDESFTGIFWTEAFIKELLNFYLELEINDEGWWSLLNDIRKDVSEILKHREAFLQYYQNNLFEYEQLLIYFIYRHFMKARTDTLLCEKILFALISTSVIQLLDVYEWLKNGRLTQTGQIDICKLYSKEIEYDEDNMERVSRVYFATGRGNDDL